MKRPPRTGTTDAPPPRLPKAPTKPHPPAPVRPRAERPRPAPGQVVLAVVAGAHGIGGEVKLKLFTDDLTPYRVFNDGTLTATTVRGNIARFAEIADRSAAEGMRGTALIVPRSQLPPLAEGEFYYTDLIGLRVDLPDGGCVGHVVSVENFGAGDLIEIERPDGKQFMVPLRPEAVAEWDEQRLILNPDFGQ